MSGNFGVTDLPLANSSNTPRITGSTAANTFSRVQARRHQVIARAFRRRRGQDRRLEFEEARLLHAAADRVDHGAAQHDVGVQLLAPQVEKAVFEPDLL